MTLRPCLLPSLLWLVCAPLSAASFTVDLDLDLADDSPGDGQCNVGAAVPPGGPRCTLRAAVMEAEANGEADSVLIPPGMLINLGLSGAGGADVGDLNISTEISISGYQTTPPADPDLLPRIDASALGDRHFNVLNGQLTLRGLRLTGGAPAFGGGALLVAGNSTSRAQVEHVLFRNNVATTRGGAIEAAGAARLDVIDSHFLRNDAGGSSGGAVALTGGVTTIRRSSFADNRDSSLGASIIAIGDAQLRLENITLDGGLLGPPTAGLASRRGIYAGGTASLIVRHATLSNFSSNAIDLFDLDGNEHVRIAHSILQGSNSGCQAAGPNLAAANVRIAYSLIEDEHNCAGFYQTLVASGMAELDELSADGASRLTMSRRPSAPLANVADAGAQRGTPVADPEFACVAEDQLGNARALDANLDERFECDLGAIELPPPQPLRVDHFTDDLPDDLPGDGECATAPLPGSGPVCTLRAAVMEANALPGLQRISFAASEDPVILSLPAASPGGGALLITDTLAIEGTLSEGRPATSIEGQMVGERLFQVDAPNVPVYLRNLALSGGDAAGRGGALAVLLDSDVFLQRSLLSDHDAINGGGAIAVLGGQLRVRDSDFHGNRSEEGALAVFANLSSQVEISHSSIRDHLGFDAGGSPQPAIGIDPGVTLRTVNTTFNGNQIAVLADRPEVLVMQHATIADQLSGGIVADLGPGARFWLNNSIVSAPGSAQLDCSLSGTNDAEFFQIDHVIDSDASCAQWADRIGLTTDPLLGPIEQAGWRISHHRPPRLGADLQSPALDLVDSDQCSVSFDQYQRARPFDLPEVANVEGPCDLGAIELAPDDVFEDGFESP